MRPTFRRRLMHIKKDNGRYSAHKAALGGRTKKTGSSRWFVGYKKHTLRLWLPHFTESVLLVPMMTWAAPANRGEALFLWPTLRHCANRLPWLPKWVVGDMAYISLENQRRIREEFQVAIVTKLRPDMRWIRSEEHTSELQSPCNLVCRLLLEK